MKLKLDENLPESLITELAALGHDVDNVRMRGLSAAMTQVFGRVHNKALDFLLLRIWTFPTCADSRRALTAA